MNRGQDLSALVVYESFFGNTAAIARGIAEGLRLEDVATTVIDVADAVDVRVQDYDLVVVGAPTHAFALSRPATRGEAVDRGGTDRYGSTGLREWLTVLPSGGGHSLAAAFDTRVSKVRHLPASAGRSAGHLLRQRGYELIARPAGFIVRDVEGPLEMRQMDHAVSWGRSIGQVAQRRTAAARGLEPHTGSDRRPR